MIEFSAFHDLLLPEVPGCTTALLDFQLRQVARDFCTRTSAWDTEFDPIELVPGQAAYDLFPTDNDAQTVRLISLVADGKLLWKSTDPEVKQVTQTHAVYACTEPPFALSNDMLQIVLADYQVPTAAGLLLVTGAVKPTLKAETLPDLLQSQFSEAMRVGVLARLMAMMKKPWTDRELSAKYASDWNAAVNFAAYQVQTGFTRAPLRVRKYG
jgi:hypothetical protein